MQTVKMAQLAQGMRDTERESGEEGPEDEDRGRGRFTGSYRRVCRACSAVREKCRRAQLGKPLVFGSLPNAAC